MVNVAKANEQPLERKKKLFEIVKASEQPLEKKNNLFKIVKASEQPLKRKKKLFTIVKPSEQPIEKKKNFFKIVKASEQQPGRKKKSFKSKRKKQLPDEEGLEKGKSALEKCVLKLKNNQPYVALERCPRADALCQIPQDAFHVGIVKIEEEDFLECFDIKEEPIWDDYVVPKNIPESLLSQIENLEQPTTESDLLERNKVETQNETAADEESIVTRLRKRKKTLYNVDISEDEFEPLTNVDSSEDEFEPESFQRFSRFRKRKRLFKDQHKQRSPQQANGERNLNNKKLRTKSDVCKSQTESNSRKVVNSDTIPLREFRAKSFNCEQCLYRSKSRSKILRHLTVHSAEKPYKCNICSFCTSQMEYLRLHILRHGVRKKKFQCEYCSYQACQKKYLTTHLRIHTGVDPYTCNRCSFQTVFKWNLTTHLRTHTDEKPFKCEMCPARFTMKSSLVTHSSIHEGDKKFQCDRCGYRTSFKGNLDVHLRTHTGEKPYRCPLCSSRFSQKSSLNIHFRTCANKSLQSINPTVPSPLATTSPNFQLVS